MMPVPSHLRSIIVPQKYIVDDGLMIGNLSCQCGNEESNLMYPGQTQEYEGSIYPCTAEIDGNFFFLIKIICTKCKSSYILFDKHFHGWNGMMCHDEQKANLPRPPLVPWKCVSCGGLSHKVTIKIAFESKEDFIEQSRGEFKEAEWPDAFQWIWITIKCCSCGVVTENWVDYETA